MFFVMANRVGTEAGTTFFGRSQAVTPGGLVTAVADEVSETMLVTEVDIREARAKTREPDGGGYAVRLFADRRPDLYGDLLRHGA